MDLKTLNPDKIESIFARHGAHSVTLSDAADRPVLEPAPGETPLWSDSRITGLFSAEADLDALQLDLLTSLQLDSLPGVRIDALPDRAWEREWLRDFGPMRFGERLWVCPGDMEADSANAVVVHLDPGLAFGTGTHATTALCLEWLDGLPVEGRSMLDYGCGSGVLAIAALRLGAVQAVAMDIDPQAVTATTQNAVCNNVDSHLRVIARASDIDGEFDIVVANILAGPLVELASSITAHVREGGGLALSGILAPQIDEVRAAYSAWIKFDDPAFVAQGGQTWARLTGTRV